MTYKEWKQYMTWKKAYLSTYNMYKSVKVTTNYSIDISSITYVGEGFHANLNSI